MATLCQTEGCNNVPTPGHKWCSTCFQAWLEKNGVECLVCGNLFALQDPRHFLCRKCAQELWDGSTPSNFESALERAQTVIEYVFGDIDEHAELVAEDQQAALEHLEQGNFWRAVAYARRAELKMQIVELCREVASQLDGHEFIGRISASLKLAESKACFKAGQLAAARGKLGWLKRQLEQSRQSGRAADELRLRLGTQSETARQQNAETAARILNGNG